jgi:RNA polymerase-binding transcription factor DksA
MMMEGIRGGRHFDQLRKRREQLVMTLQHIGREQDQVEQNTDWLDQAAYQSRVNLLDRLNEWYIDEMHQIDEALLRIRKNQYGRCLGCHYPIDIERLESVPEAEFCSSCQEVRDGLEER